MTIENYTECTRHCFDLLIAAGLVRSSMVQADGGAEFFYTDKGVELSDDILDLLKAARHPTVQEVLITILSSSSAAEEKESFTDTQARFRF